MTLADLKSLESSPSDLRSSRKQRTVLTSPARISRARASSDGPGYSDTSPVTKAPRMFGVRSAETSLPSSSATWLAMWTFAEHSRARAAIINCSSSVCQPLATIASPPSLEISTALSTA